MKREKISTVDRIFEKKHLQKFKESRHNVLFVYDRDGKGKQEILRGVVHVSDYNRDVVLAALQEDLLKFERLLRQYLILSKKKNEDMLGYIKYKAKKNSYFADKLKRAESEKGQEAIKKLGLFQTFDLRDLLFFIQSSRNKVPLTLEEDAPERLGELRNLAMHAKNTIELEEERLYSTDSLARLLDDLHLLKKEYLNAAAKLEALPESRDMLRARNRATLDMIHKQGVSSLVHLLTNV